MKLSEARRRAAVATAAAAVVGPVSVPIVFPESAAAAPAYCRGNSICLYRGNGFTQTVAWFYAGNDDGNYAAHDGYSGDAFIDGRPLDNQVRSVWNNTNRWVMFCTDAVHGYGSYCNGNSPGVQHCYQPGAGSDDPDPYDGGYSAHAFYNSLIPSGCEKIIERGCSV